MKEIPLFKVYMSDKAPEAVSEVLKSGYIGQGPKVEEFEEELRKFFNQDFILTTNSGTSAEHLAIHILKKPFAMWRGIQEGDEVLAPALTCSATNWPILLNGLKIKWVDVDPTTMNIDLDDLARKITPKTKLIVLVHWGGYPVDLDRLKQIQENARKMYGSAPEIIEDCAHSFGSKFNGKLIGTHGNICFFSFQAIKHLTSVDGGCLILPYPELYRWGKLERWYGIDRDSNRKDFRCEADIESVGWKFHMNDVCAAVGLANLKEVQENVIAKNKANAHFYNEALRDVPGVTLLENDPRKDSAYWLYTLRVAGQDDFMNKMKEKGIIVSRVHERNDKHTCVQEYQTQLPNLDKVIQEMICIPHAWWVTEEDRQYIVDTIKDGW